MMQNDKMGLTFVANVVIADLAKKANIILIIPNMVLQTCAHSINTTCAVFHNKTGKMSELGSLAGFA